MLGKDIISQQDLPLKTIATRSFVGGIFWGLGTIVGASTIVAIIGLVLSKVITFPVLGAFVGAIIQNIPL